MTVFRLLKVDKFQEQDLRHIFEHFKDWTSVQTSLKSPNKSKLLENLIPRLDNFIIPDSTIGIGDSHNVNYKTLVAIPGSEETIWINSNNSKVYYPQTNCIILQQPGRIFERLFRFALEFNLKKPISSPFYNKDIGDVIKAIENELDKKDCEITINRMILLNIDFNNEQFLEVNIKKNKIPNRLIKQLSMQAEKWHAFTSRIVQYHEMGEDRFSLRIDRHGNILLYGRHYEDRASFVAQILGSVMKILR